MDVLKSLNKQIAVIGVTRVSSVGKSYTLNEIMEYDGFKLGKDTNSMHKRLVLVD